MRIIFMGTPDFAVPVLDALVAAGHEVVAAYTQPPRPAGRGKRLQPSPVQLAAERLGIPVCSPETLRGAAEQAEFAALGADAAVVAAYGLILPRWRGAAPIQRAILAGDADTGVTIMQMEAGLDTGPMRHIVTTPVADKTAGALTEELAAMGAAAMVAVLGDLAAYPPVTQDDTLVTHAPKIDKAEARIDWTTDAAAIERQVRAFAPWPGAWFDLSGERIKLLTAELVEGSGPPGEVLDDALTIACGRGALRPVTIQRAGKPAMDAAAFLRGRPVPAGTRLA